jgi:GNAT superfamily N-acetyltransferase
MTEPALEIRLATVADVAEILPMMADFNGIESIPWEPQAGQGPLRTLLADPTLGFMALAIRDGAPCGYAVVTYGYDLEYGGRDAFLTELYATAPVRGTGLGSTLLAAVESLAAERGVHVLHLMVRPENPALRLYQRQGFRPTPRLFLSKRLA